MRGALHSALLHFTLRGLTAMYNPRAALSATALSVFLSGCVATNTVIPGYTDQPSKINFLIVDARPDEEKTTERMYELIGDSCNAGITQIGDDASAPSRLTILQQDIERKLGQRLSNTSLTVTRYRMYLNKHKGTIDKILPKDKLLPGVANEVLGLICTKDNTPVGWYDDNEVTNGNSPIIAEIAANYLGKQYSVRIVYSPDLEMVPAAFRTADQAPSVYAAMEKANLALIEKLQQ